LNASLPPGPPPRPLADLDQRSLPLYEVPAGTLLYRIHRTRIDPLFFGRHSDPARRQRWDAPDASYGVCYLALESHIAFAETLLRDLSLDTVHLDDLYLRSLAHVEVGTPLRVVEMHSEHLRPLGADASAVQGSYNITWAWSAVLHAHRSKPDGIRYRARHDDSGFSVAVFERAAGKLHCTATTPLNDTSLAAELARWLERYQLSLTT
jgi:hypothetical protein